MSTSSSLRPWSGFVLGVGAFVFIVSLLLPAYEYRLLFANNSSIGLECAIVGFLGIENPLVIVAAFGNVWLFALTILYALGILNRKRALIAAAVTLTFACVDASLQFFSSGHMPQHGSVTTGYYVWVASYFIIALGLVLHAFTSANRAASFAAPA